MAVVKKMAGAGQNPKSRGGRAGGGRGHDGVRDAVRPPIPNIVSAPQIRARPLIPLLLLPPLTSRALPCLSLPSLPLSQ